MPRKVFLLPVEISWEEDTYLARCPVLQGAFAEGESPEEALRELLEVIRLILEYRKEGEELPKILKVSEEAKWCMAVPVQVHG